MSEPTRTSSSPGSSPPTNWAELLDEFRAEAETVRQGGGAAAIKRQHGKQRMTARERIAALLDPPRSPDSGNPDKAATEGERFLETGLWAGYGMYGEWGGAPSAGVVCGIGPVSGRQCMIIANDATVKAGAFFPATAKKVLRAQRMALENRLPLIYLVDSAGVFLPLQDEIFPDEDDFGRIFRNNAVLSATGIPQLAAIMGNCVAGGGYLPVLCDQLLMTEGSGLYLAGPALVRSSIGQQVSHEELGGAAMHARISGTIDYREVDDAACLHRLRELVRVLPADPRSPLFVREESIPPARSPEELQDVFPVDPQQPYEVRDVLNCLLDEGSFQEYRAEYGETIVCGTARLGGISVGIVANQHHPVKTPEAGIQFGGVIYHQSADKAARFIMTCNQSWTPLLFLQDVYGFMVGRDSEQAGIIPSGAALVNAISNSRVPKLTLITGGSYGAGNYAMCGKAFDPRFLFAWQTAKYAVMGAKQAAATLLDVSISAMKREGRTPDVDELEELKARTEAQYTDQTDIRYAAARGWVDAVIEPAETRTVLRHALSLAIRYAEDRPFQTGVLQV